MARPIGSDPVEPLEGEERERNTAAADARIKAGSTPGTSFPSWGYVLIGVGFIGVVAVAFYFLTK